MVADLLAGWYCLRCKLLFSRYRLTNCPLMYPPAQQMIFGCMLYSSLITSVRHTDSRFKVLEPRLAQQSLVSVSLVSVPLDPI